MFDFDSRRERFHAEMEAAGLELTFLPLSGDLHYLTGFARRLPTYGDIGYAHDWVAGGYFRPGSDPVFVLPRMMVEFEAPEGVPGEVVVVGETDDPEPLMAAALEGTSRVPRLGLGRRARAETVIHLQELLGSPELADASAIVNRQRRVKSRAELATLEEACRIAADVLSEVIPSVQVGSVEREIAEEVDHRIANHGSVSPSFDTGVFSVGRSGERDADVRVSDQTLATGDAVSFDFGAVIDGYCSDFGRTIFVGEPDDDSRRAYEVVMEAQAAGIEAARPGATAAEVDAATRAVIAGEGLGEWFRHRTGHCIGLDVHEHPYISEEDYTELEEGMTFTVEPSVFRPGGVGVRVEDVIVCEPGGGRRLVDYPTDLVVV
jgi:Xaa-Pro aminopeptidase